MTSDDTKVDTSGWIANGKKYVLCQGKRYGDNFIASFNSTEHRDFVLLAIQSLPKVTAERDKLTDDMKLAESEFKRLAQLAKEYKAHCSALSARVKELEAQLKRAEVVVLAADKWWVNKDNRSENSYMHAYNKWLDARVLIGKEPS